MRIEKIANRQLLFIVFIMRTTIVIATLPVLTSAEARQDAWASAVITFLGTTLIVYIIAGLGARFPELNVVEISRKLLGRTGGALISVIILWSFLHIASLETRIYTEMLITGFLDETPIVILTATMVLASAAAAYAGLEVIGRIADLVFPLFLFMIVVSLGSLLLEAEFANLQPVLARGPQPVLEGSISPIAFGSQLLILGILIPSVNSPRKATATAFWGIAAASAVLVATAALVVAVLGPDEGMRAVFPLTKSVRAIQFSEFLERIEALGVFAWGFGLFIALSTFIYSGARGAEQLFGLKGYRFLLLPMAVAWVVISIHGFANVFEIRSFVDPGIFGPYGFFLAFFPYSILWGAYLLRRLLGQDPRERESGGEK